MKSRWFFGLWRVPMYEYLYGYTCAQLELMCVDKPFVAYKKRSGDADAPGVTSEAKQIAAVERWKERRKNRKFNFQEFLQKGANVAGSPRR